MTGSYTAKPIAIACTQILVADVTVGQLLPSHWNTPHGLRPPDVTARNPNSGGAGIYTPVTFSQMQVLVDHRAQWANALPTREYALSGGTVGQDQITDLDAPQLLPGHRYLVIFIPGLNAHATSYTGQWLIIWGAYPITTQNMVVVQQRDVEQGAVVQQEQDVPLAQIAHQLAGC